jgi:hypothetical protein
MRRKILLGVLLFAAARARAQYLPEMEVTPILKEKRPHMLASKVAVADCYTSALPGAQREEVALIKVTVRGSWERSAQHLASEKAAELGANCLLVVSSYGKDNAEYPVHRSYKAFRVTVPYGPWRVPASAESLASAAAGAAAPAFPMPRLSVPVIEKKPSVTHGDHLSRAMGEAVYVHEAVLDPARADPEMWADVVQDVREYFGAAEAEKLARLVEAGKMVRVDLRAGTVSGL